MKLFKFDEYKLKISEEALAIKAFRELWTRDKSKDKGTAIAELGFIYFYLDPRSDYMFLVDQETRAAKIKEQEGLPSKWKPDEKVKAAMEVYKYLVNSEKSMLLEDTRAMVGRIRAELRGFDFTRVADPKLRLDMIEKAAKTTKMIPELIRNLNEAEKAVIEEIEDESRVRGDAVKHLFEDGFNFEI